MEGFTRAKTTWAIFAPFFTTSWIGDAEPFPDVGKPDDEDLRF